MWFSENPFRLPDRYAVLSFAVASLVEFNPFSWSQWAALLILVVAIATAALFLALRQRRVSNVSLAFALTALAFGLVTVRTARFTEYFVPFSVMAFALALQTFPKPLFRFAPIPLLAIALVYQGAEEARLLARLREWPNRNPFLCRQSHARRHTCGGPGFHL